MIDYELKHGPGGAFHLKKWFLDFVDENGGAMIFYAAKLTWHGCSASYTSWLRYEKSSGVVIRSRFSKVQMPHINDNVITWNDPKFGIAGTWESREKMVQARLFDSEEGFLEWKCYQPVSQVQLRINDFLLQG